MQKKCILLFILFIIFYANATDSLTLKNPEDLANAVLKSFKTNDFELFNSLLIKEADYESLATNRGLFDTLYRQRGIDFIKNINSDAKKNFDDAVQKAKSNNINWDKATVKEIKVYTKQSGGIESGDIIIYLISENINFMVSISSCHKKTTWIVMNKVFLNVYTINK